MLCRHCRQAPASRPRGLCRDCYYCPAVRRRYQRQFIARRGEDRNGDFPLPPEPTAALPGTAEKIAVLRRRVILRCQLWHPGDARMDEEEQPGNTGQESGVTQAAGFIARRYRRQRGRGIRTLQALLRNAPSPINRRPDHTARVARVVAEPRMPVAMA